jgi:DnaA family protein
MCNKTPVQLSLDIQLHDQATFANYWVSAENHIVNQAVRQCCLGLGDFGVLIWGGASSGLSHLLQACCHESQSPAAYLPMRDALRLDPNSICHSLENSPMVCIDDLDLLATNADWERAFFHLFNRLRDKGHRLLMATHANPSTIDWTLPDVRSRVLGSVVYRVSSLTDEQKAAALIMRAKVRGIPMSQEVAVYILNRVPRSMRELFGVLERLDIASLQLQKKLTVRVVKKILDEISV